MRVIHIMANKALAKRQKLTIRIEPSQQALKPRNHVALAAKTRIGGSHQKSVSAQRQIQKLQLQKKLTKPDEE
ncbi:hypothetical protein [Herminiimonas sp.]|uniref:hypothetical protein n=1 Tax=Herminiimonas sp. TaxID=1926289 RepID=UPI00351F6B5F